MFNESKRSSQQAKRRQGQCKNNVRNEGWKNVVISTAKDVFLNQKMKLTFQFLTWALPFQHQRQSNERAIFIISVIN